MAYIAGPVANAQPKAVQFTMSGRIVLDLRKRWTVTTSELRRLPCALLRVGACENTERDVNVRRRILDTSATLEMLWL
jgi:hypothetical protein